MDARDNRSMTDAAIHDTTRGQEVPASRAPQLALNEELMASPARFFNRETSWLAFNERVLRKSARLSRPACPQELRGPGRG